MSKCGTNDFVCYETKIIFFKLLNKKWEVFVVLEEKVCIHAAVFFRFFIYILCV